MVTEMLFIRIRVAALGLVALRIYFEEGDHRTRINMPRSPETTQKKVGKDVVRAADASGAKGTAMGSGDDMSRNGSRPGIDFRFADKRSPAATHFWHTRALILKLDSWGKLEGRAYSVFADRFLASKDAGLSLER